MPMYQVMFSKNLVAELLTSTQSFDNSSIEHLMNEIEKQVIQNQKDRTIITLGQTKLILATLDDVQKAREEM